MRPKFVSICQDERLDNDKARCSREYWGLGHVISTISSTRFIIGKVPRDLIH